MTPTHWATPPRTVQLDRHDVHLWLTTLDTSRLDTSALLGELDEEEIRRAEKFRFESDYARYVLSHAMLRRCLGSYVDVQPKRIVLASDQNGKPHLVDPTDAGITFNLSHSGDCILIGFAKNRAIGVDIERLRSLKDMEHVVDLSFSASERAAFRALAVQDQLAAFYRIWVQKEAYLKACGSGLKLPLDKVSVTADPHQPVALHAVDTAEASNAREWLMHEMTTAPGYMAVAVVGNGPTVFSHWTTAGLV